jgi:hypothetical protein
MTEYIHSYNGDIGIVALLDDLIWRFASFYLIVKEKLRGGNLAGYPNLILKGLKL